MTSEPLTRDQVLRTVAEQLDDAALLRFFPGHDPASIRQLITGLPPEQASFSAPPAPSPETAEPAKETAAGRCRLFTDGASRGNPGQAGAGAVLLTENGEELAALSVYLGTCTNNVAEYKALIIGLQEALRRGCTDLAISLDSELIVRQIQGRYKVKNEALLTLFNEVRMHLARLGKWSITHVPRAQNARADQLANKGIDQKDGCGYR